MDANTAKSKTPPILVVLKAMSLLKCFTNQEPAHTLASLSEKLDMPRSTIHRLLLTLQQGNFISADSAGTYHLGISLLELSSAVLHNFDFRRIARPILQDLSDHTGETVYLSTLSGENIVYLDEIMANRYIVMSTRLGTTAPAYCSAMGKMLLSELTDAQFDRVMENCALAPRTEKTIVDPESLRENLRRIADQGYAFDDGEFEDGICCIAVPIRNHDGNMIASFSISAPSARLNADTMSDMLRKVLAASGAINLRLGYIP